MDVVAVVAVGYLLGSIPVAGVVARRHGVADLRDVGDRNPGYWNAKATLGRGAAVPIFVGDAAKGALAAGIGAAFSSDWGVGYLAGGAAMVGHAWPVFASLRGGRSVLTFAGAIWVLSPVAAAAATAVLLAVTIASRSFAAGARAGVAVLPFAQLAIEGLHRTAATGCLMTLIGLRFARVALTDRRGGSRRAGEAGRATGGAV